MLLPTPALCGIMLGLLGTTSASHHGRDSHAAQAHEARKLKAHYASVERRVQSFQSKFTALTGDTKPHFDKIKQACIITDMLGMGNPAKAEDQGNQILDSLDSVHSAVSNAASFPQGSATGSTVCTPQGPGGAQYAKAAGGSSPARSQFIPGQHRARADTCPCPADGSPPGTPTTVTVTVPGPNGASPAPPKTVTVTVTLGPNGNPIGTSPPSSPNGPPGNNPVNPPGSPITLTITKAGQVMTTVVPGGLSPAAYSSLLNGNVQPQPTSPPTGGDGRTSPNDTPTTITITLPDGSKVPLTAPPGVHVLTVELPNGQTTTVPVPAPTGPPGGGSPASPGGVPASPNDPNAPTTVTVTLPNGQEVTKSVPAGVRTVTVTLPNGSTTTVPVPAPTNPPGGSPGSPNGPTTVTVTLPNGQEVTQPVPAGVRTVTVTLPNGSTTTVPVPAPTGPPGGSPGSPDGSSPGSPNGPTVVTITLPNGQQLPVTAPPGVKTITVTLPGGAVTTIPVPAPTGGSPGSPGSPPTTITYTQGSGKVVTVTNPGGGGAPSPTSPPGGSPDGGSPNDPNAPTTVTITLPNGQEVPAVGPPGAKTITVTLPNGDTTEVPAAGPTDSPDGPNPDGSGGSSPITITVTQGNGQVITHTIPAGVPVPTGGYGDPSSPPGYVPGQGAGSVCVTTSSDSVGASGSLGCAGLFSGCLGHLTDCFSGLMGSMHYFSPDMQSKIKSKYANVHAAFGTLEDGANSHLPGFSQHVKQLNAHKPANNQLS